MEDKHDEVEDIESASGDSFIDDSDDDGPSTSGQEDDLHLEASYCFMEHLTEEEIEEIIAEFLEVESKAAEAQEALELESLAKVEREVREELSQKLHDDDLEVAVKDEMTGYREQWEAVLDELETESAHLLEQLDGAGIELPSLYKWIESQAPNGCCTEAWKKRAHWAGTQATSEMTVSITEAEEYLEIQRPVRRYGYALGLVDPSYIWLSYMDCGFRKHGKLLEEGASGFLQKKLASDGTKDTVTENSDINWSSVNKMFSSDSSGDCTLFGSKHWASVYLASTPQQAAAMGLKFPGVEETAKFQVEEIEDVDGNSSDPFVADAIANEKELVLSEEQRKNFRKVKEEDDANIDRKLQLHLKRRRHRKRSKQGVTQKGSCSVDQENENNLDEPRPLVDYSNSDSDNKTSENGEGGLDNKELAGKNLMTDLLGDSGTFDNFDKERSMSNGTTSTSESALHDSTEPRGCKRSNESEEPENDKKRNRTIIIDCDGQADELKDKSESTKLEDLSILHENINSVTDNSIPSQSVNEKFYCTVCHKVAIEVHPHPLLKVIVCKDCKCLLEEKIHVKDADCSECYCGWCGQSSDLVSCNSCKTLFCSTCVKRNLGEAYLSESQGSCWQCCCCSPSLLQRLTLELEKAMGSEDVIVSSSESDSENSDAENNLALGGKRKRKKKIRRILDDAELGEETKRKIAIEKERQERLKSLQVQFSTKSCMMSSATCDGGLSTGASFEVLGDAITGHIVNVVREKGEEAVRIAPSISTKLKAHQVVGIRFMWENIIQSIRKVKSGDKGLGCILAHTMGLGKTLQRSPKMNPIPQGADIPQNIGSSDGQCGLSVHSCIGSAFAMISSGFSIVVNVCGLPVVKIYFQVIAFLYTAMRSVDLGLRTVLIVTPVNVLHNWRQEFLKWRPSELKPLRVYMLEDVSRSNFYVKPFAISPSQLVGGIENSGELGVDLEPRMVTPFLLERRAELLAKWRAKGGVFLIGYTAFRNLSLGKHVKDRHMAREICHALQSLDKCSFESKDGPDLLVCDEAHMIKNTRADTTQALKQVKCQRRIALTGSPLQNNLMEYYCRSFQNPIENGQHTNSTSEDVKIMNQRSHILYEQLKGFVQRMDMNVVKKDLPPKTVFVITVKLSPLQRKLYKRFLDVHVSLIRKSFFAGYQALAQIWNHPGILQLTKEDRGYPSRDDADAIDSSSDENIDYNMVVGDKSKNVNDILQGKNDAGFFRKDWWNDLLHEHTYKELDYSGKMVLLVEILTMSADMGDKALVFSQSIPTLDLIEFYLSRLPRPGKKGKFWKKGKDWYRYGQTKPVFAYRLMAHGTMEEKIYKRQVTKEGLAARVVDRQQVHRTISKEEMLHLFEFGDDENSEPLTELSQANGQENSQNSTCKIGNLGSCPSDKLMESLLGKHNPRWIANYHEHETLLQENEEDRLSKEEQDMAWEVYQKTMEWEEVQRVPVDESAPERKPAPVPNVVPSKPESSDVTQPRGSFRNRVVLRKCTNLSHLLTLRSQGTKRGCSTVCGECAQVIRWEDLNRDGKPSR
ncbi:hypothetical protein JRO89_XS04G0150700 [Xanthoceras sorbifolium]|uniref:PHD-type domain-containing protein n=1 Tax=Xanthoceras sorbifolium TaxID=99658 RepID=A0ABQ8I5B2_9ROSI|nr:hypothetical protein JRO89_XS04G0150700 [Xanthoceras sorbifolium]